MYVYIFQSGEVQSSQEPPTDADLEQMETGLLTVLMCECSVYAINADRKIHSLNQCDCAETEDGIRHVIG